MSLPPVVKNVIVPCSTEDAFRYFTEDFGKWWPGHTHSVVASQSDGKESPEACVLEPRSGGRIYERATGGKEHEWGKILRWEPPSFLSFTWHPGRTEDQEQTVEIVFTKVGDGTSVQLTHKGFERLGEQAGSVRNSYESGWGIAFGQHYAGFVKLQKEG